MLPAVAAVGGRAVAGRAVAGRAVAGGALSATQFPAATKSLVPDAVLMPSGGGAGAGGGGRGVLTGMFSPGGSSGGGGGGLATLRSSAVEPYSPGAVMPYAEPSPLNELSKSKLNLTGDPLDAVAGGLSILNAVGEEFINEVMMSGNKANTSGTMVR